MWYKAVCIGHPMKIELTGEGWLVSLANPYPTLGTHKLVHVYWVAHPPRPPPQALQVPTYDQQVA